MTPSLPRAPQVGSRQVVEALRKLAAEVGGLKAFEPGVRDAIGNTNWTVLMQRLDEAEAALSRTAQAPVADGVREAAQILLSEIDSATDMDCVIAASSALRTALASSDPTPATEAGGDEVAAQRLAASPLPSSSETEWRPIETAPKDGTWIIAYRPSKGVGYLDRVVLVRWDEEVSAWVWPDEAFDVYEDDFQDRVNAESFGDRIDPFEDNSFTHWMPLPAAPVSHGGAE